MGIRKEKSTTTTGTANHIIYFGEIVDAYVLHNEA